MSEYTESHEAARLFESAPGLVGYEDGGRLTNAVRRNPNAIILFDEIEKAHYSSEKGNKDNSITIIVLETDSCPFGLQSISLIWIIIQRGPCP